MGTTQLVLSSFTGDDPSTRAIGAGLPQTLGDGLQWMRLAGALQIPETTPQRITRHK